MGIQARMPAVPRRSWTARRRSRLWAAWVLAISLATLPAEPITAAGAEASAASPESSAAQTGRKAFDLAILRPLQLVQVAVSALVFAPAYALSWPFGGGDDVLEICITEPIDRAFRRPLGEL